MGHGPGPRAKWGPPALQVHIVLSFAPSAAAVWHCDRERITCERNSARHSVFPFKRLAGQYVFAPVFSPRKYKNNKNKTKQNNNNCSPFLTGNVGGIVPASLSPNRFKKQDGMLAFFWYRLEFPYQKCLKNKTECSPLFCSSFFGTVPPIVLPKMCKKQDGLFAFFLVLCLRCSHQKC